MRVVLPRARTLAFVYCSRRYNLHYFDILLIIGQIAHDAPTVLI
jgi:hypothetical protein